MSVWNKKPEYVLFPAGADQQVHADTVYVAIVEKAQDAGFEGPMRLLGIVADVATGVVKSGADIQARRVEALVKQGLRAPVKDEPTDETGAYADSYVRDEIQAYGELGPEDRQTLTDLFNLVRGELVVAGRLST